MNEFYKVWVCSCGKKNIMSTQKCDCNHANTLEKWKASMRESCLCECGNAKESGRDMCRSCNPFEYTNPIEYRKNGRKEINITN